MDPHRDQQRKLTGQAERRIRDPKKVEHTKIGILQAIQQDAKPGVGHVWCEQERYREPEPELQGLDRRHAQVSASKKNRQAKAEVDQERRQQERKPDGGPPRRQQNVVAHPLEAVEQEEAGCMADKVASRISEKNRDRPSAGSSVPPAT